MLAVWGVLAGIAADMTAVCPEAWLLNYTNPMAMMATDTKSMATNWT